MNAYNRAVELAQAIVEGAAEYQAKPTKAQSKRLRALIGDMKKVATGAKADLIAADKGEMSAE